MSWAFTVQAAGDFYLPFSKDANDLVADSTYKSPAILKVTDGHEIELRVTFPEERRADAIEMNFRIHLERDANNDLSYRLGLVSGDHKLKLDYWEIPRIGSYHVYLTNENDSRAGVLKDPPNITDKDRKESADRMLGFQKSVGYSEKIVGDTISNCTVTVIGHNLVLTNNHCLSRQEQCDHMDLYFEDPYGLGGQKKFHCGSIVKTNFDLDFTILRTTEDPTPRFPALEVITRRHYVEYGSLLYFIRNRPDEGNHQNYCTARDGVVPSKVTIDGKNYHRDPSEMYCLNPVKPGYSGSPVINFEGKLVGLLWGDATDDPKNASYTPLWKFFEKMDQDLLKGLGLRIANWDDLRGR